MSSAKDRDDDDDGAASGLSPVQTPPIRDDQQGSGQDEMFDVVETDDQGQPIGGAAQQPAGEEGRLSEQDAGTQPLIRQGEGQQGDGAQRREPKSQRNRRRAESRERRDTELQRVNQENSEMRQRLDALEGRMGTQVEPRLLELGEGRLRDQVARLD